MKISSRHGDHPWQAFNLDTGEKIPLCLRADDETGEYEHYVPDAKGRAQLAPNDPTRFLKAKGKCRLRLVPPGEPVPVTAAAEHKIRFREFL